MHLDDNQNLIRIIIVFCANFVSFADGIVLRLLFAQVAPREAGITL